MPLPTTFAPLSTATGAMLDNNFAALGALTPIPCTITGTNALTLTPASTAPTVVGYANYGEFVGVAAASNTGPVTANVAALGARPVYQDTGSGPVALAGGEIATGTVVTLVYDSALNGFHLGASRVRSVSAGSVSGTLPVANGGTGITTTPGNGQLLIGNGSGYAVSTLTAGANISIANTPGGVTISSIAGGGVLAVANGGTGTTTSTGTGSVVLNGSPTLTGNVAVSGTLAMGGSFLRNRLINGGMAVDQRNNGVAQSLTTTLGYTVDRWWAITTGASVTGQRVAGPDAAHQYVYQITGGAGVTGIGLAQRIESANCYDFSGSNTVFSVSLSNSTLTTVTWTAYYAGATDNWASATSFATGTFTVNGTLARYTAQIAVPAAATTGIQIRLDVGAQTSGTWTIGNAQWESGTVATPFERRQYGAERVLCYRYFSKLTSVVYIQGYGSGGAWAYQTYNYPTEMRTVPTATANFGGGVNLSGAPTITNVGTFSLQAAVNAGSLGDYVAYWGSNNTLTAEL